MLVVKRSYTPKLVPHSSGLAQSNNSVTPCVLGSMVFADVSITTRASPGQGPDHWVVIGAARRDIYYSASPARSRNWAAC
eukprot:6204587-Pleurochrysis_carterae.AAC.1